MAAIWAICRRDLLAAFASPLMWLVLACWSALIDLVFWLDLRRVHGTAGADTPLFVDALASGIFFLTLLAPALTMNSFALERTQGTMQLLLTVPVRERQLVLGKVLAAFLALATLVLATAVQPLVLAFVSQVPPPQLLAGYAGLLLACALFAALGVWISLLVDSPVSAYVITFAVIAVLLVIGWMGDQGFTGALAHTLGLQRRAEGFFNGEVRLGDVAYFAGGATAFVIMAISVLSARRIHG
jgi:ABC-2 type transport system permease protein